MSSLTKRLLVAVVAIPLVLFLVFYRVIWPFKVLTVIVLGMGLWEYLQMCQKSGVAVLKLRSLAALALLITPACLDVRGPWIPPLLVACLWLVVFGILFSKNPVEGRLAGVSFGLFGICYFGFLGSYFFLLRGLENGSWALLLLLMATWAYDTGGYVVGGLWGKHKLFPEISPKKSWEGVAGGVVLCVVAVMVWRLLLSAYGASSRVFGVSELVLVALLLSASGQVGDLVESMVKRSLKVKDSGGIIPGHGGIFDRIDSLLFNAPVLFYYLMFFQNF
jgi:phosphatidate cytidylyltransferase